MNKCRSIMGITCHDRVVVFPSNLSSSLRDTLNKTVLPRTLHPRGHRLVRSAAESEWKLRFKHVRHVSVMHLGQCAGTARLEKSANFDPKFVHGLCEEIRQTNHMGHSPNLVGRSGRIRGSINNASSARFSARDSKTQCKAMLSRLPGIPPLLSTPLFLPSSQLYMPLKLAASQ